MVTLSSIRALLFEISLNGPRILWRTVNDFSLWRIIEYPWVTRHLNAKPGDIIVDIGSGTSTYPHMLTKTGLDVIIIELDADRVRWQAQKRRDTAQPGDGRLIPIVADATKMPFRDGTIHRISAVSSLEHIPDDHAVGREIARVLSDDGIAVMTLPYTSTERTSFMKGIRNFAQVAKNTFDQVGKSGSFFRFYTDQDLKEVYFDPADAIVTARSAFGRSILNGRYHETPLTKYWRTLVIKDILLAWIIHPLEEMFDSTDPMYVMLAYKKGKSGHQE